MAYTLITHEEVTDALKTLPSDALPTYAEAITLLQLTPSTAGRAWNPAKPHGLRELIFHDGLGTILYQVIEHAEEVHLVRVQHLG